ncbi:MAG: MBL fold metallo-hydrolase [Peptococcaceae bacterium]|nr:MBL fold metallo-hydrolase [Peptococcaceae bacterium]
MYELIPVAPHTYYIQSPAKIGVVETSDGHVVLIDSGNDKEAGRKVRQHLDRQDWTLDAIYNTHSNADHIGGNAYLAKQTGCALYAPGIEAAFTQHPILEPALLYGGYPMKALRHKFLLAQESDAQPLTPEHLPAGFELIPLPGHFFDMIGLRTPDDVVFLADCLSSQATLDKYQISYVYDVAAYLDTLERVKEMHAALFVPAHADATEDIAPLAQYNIDKVNEIAGHILDFCAAPHTFEEVLQHLFTSYDLAMTFEQYALVGSTVRNYLSWLLDSERLSATFTDNRLLWQRV